MFQFLSTCVCAPPCRFIREDLPLIDGLEVEYKHGLSPRIHFYADGEETDMERIDKLSREDIRSLLLSRGFQFASSDEEPAGDDDFTHPEL